MARAIGRILRRRHDGFRLRARRIRIHPKRARQAWLVWVCVLAGLGGVGAGESIGGSGVRLDPEWKVGAWIWDARWFDKQTCRFWRGIDIPEEAPVARARLRITADNGFRLMVDGREVGRGSDWRSLTEYDLTQLFRPGRHVLAVEAFNDRLEAGVLAGLVVTLMNGRSLEIATDTNWWVVPGEERGWERRRQPRPGWRPAVVVGGFGTAPWTTRPLAVTEMPALQPLELRFWQRGWFQLALLACCAAAVVSSLGLMIRLTGQREAERLLHRERMRMARDLHDELGAGLTQLLLLAEVARKEPGAGDRVRESLEALCSRARALGAALDEIVWAVNSRRDTLRDFVSHTCKYAGTFLEQAGMRCRLDVPPDLPAGPFALPCRRNLFLAVKEALNNAVRHSGAPEIHLRFRHERGRISVQVEDAGRGFDPAGVSEDRNGLANLRQRMAEVGGQCAVESAPGKGCRVTLEVPLHPPAGRWWRRGRTREAGAAAPVRVPAAGTGDKGGTGPGGAA
ncbi:MAG: ATP-binding protein [Limisphaera sp.]|nr:ATP-binding protein [Limisphaera sp.]